MTHNRLTTTNSLGLTTSNPYFNNENIHEALTCQNNETVKIKMDRFETYNSNDKLHVTTSNGVEQGESIMIILLFILCKNSPVTGTIKTAFH